MNIRTLFKRVMRLFKKDIPIPPVKHKYCKDSNWITYIPSPPKRYVDINIVGEIKMDPISHHMKTKPYIRPICNVCRHQKEGK